VQSLADPKNKQEQEDYIQQLEQQGEVPKDVDLAHPKVSCQSVERKGPLENVAA